MFTEKAFQEAESKGYKCVNRVCSINFTRQEIDTDRDYFFTLGDPRFWQALGEARGWTLTVQYPKWKKEEGTSLILFYPDSSWCSWMHRYFDHIIEFGHNDHQQFFKQFYSTE